MGVDCPSTSLLLLLGSSALVTATALFALPVPWFLNRTGRLKCQPDVILPPKIDEGQGDSLTARLRLMAMTCALVSCCLVLPMLECSALPPWTALCVIAASDAAFLSWANQF